MLLASMRSRRTATVSASTVSLTAPIVLAGLGPAIHVFLDANGNDVHGVVKLRHDDGARPVPECASFIP